MSYKFYYSRQKLLADFQAVTDFLSYAPCEFTDYNWDGQYTTKTVDVSGCQLGIVTTDGRLTIQGHDKTSGIIRYTELPIKGNIAFEVPVSSCREVVELLKATAADTVEVELNLKGLWVAGERLVNLGEKTTIVSNLLTKARLIGQFELPSVNLLRELKAAAEWQLANLTANPAITLASWGVGLSFDERFTRKDKHKSFNSDLVANGEVIGAGQQYGFGFVAELLKVIPPHQEVVAIQIYQPPKPDASTPYLLVTKAEDTLRLMALKPLYIPSTV